MLSSRTITSFKSRFRLAETEYNRMSTASSVGYDTSNVSMYYSIPRVFTSRQRHALSHRHVNWRWTVFNHSDTILSRCRQGQHNYQSIHAFLHAKWSGHCSLCCRRRSSTQDPGKKPLPVPKDKDTIGHMDLFLRETNILTQAQTASTRNEDTRTMPPKTTKEEERHTFISTVCVHHKPEK